MISRPEFERFHCEVDPHRTVRGKDWSRVEFLADFNNRAVEAAIAKYPDTTHILKVESYYLRQPFRLFRLMELYDELNADIILGAITWTDVHRGRQCFYDAWSVPEFEALDLCDLPQERFVQVSGAGSVLIFPVDSWKKNPFHNIPDQFPEKFFYNIFCEESGLPVFAATRLHFLRHLPQYSLFKELRIQLGLKTNLVKTLKWTGLMK